jgi:hypothetical protein
VLVFGCGAVFAGDRCVAVLWRDGMCLWLHVAGVVRDSKSLDRETVSPVAGGKRTEQQNRMESGAMTALNPPKRCVFLGCGAFWSRVAARRSRASRVMRC